MNSEQQMSNKCVKMGLFGSALSANIRFYFVSHKSGMVDGFADKIRAARPRG